MSIEVPLPDVQRVYLDREWPEYEYPDHLERKFPETDEFVSWHCFEVVADVDPSALAAALRALLRHHDALRTRLVKRDGRWIQRIEEDCAVSLDIAEKEDEAFERGLHSLSLTRGPILHCTYLRRRGGGLLFLFYHHVLVDWISAQVLAEDLETALAQADQGRDIRLAPGTTAVGAWIEQLERAVHDEQWEPELRRLAAYKRSFPAVPYTPFPAEWAEDQPAADEVRVSLEPARTAALLRPSGGVRFLDVLQSALARTLAPWAGLPALPICVVMHGRDQALPGVDLTRTVGSFAMGLLEVVATDGAPRRSPLADPRLRFAQVLLNFSRRLEMVYESDGSSPYVSVYDRYNPQVSLNFVGRVESASPGMLRASMEEGWRDTRIRAVSRSLDCVVAVERGGLQVTWKYSPRYYRPATMEGLARAFVDELAGWS
jgi:condensation domain-containing protein